jgi:hypothetical protein
MSDNFLEHYGVKGMKWGIRKQRQSVKKQATQTAKKLTNKELQKRVNRLNMEKQYAKLEADRSRASMSTKEKGKEEVGKIVKNFGGHYTRQLTKKAGKGAANVTADFVKKSLELVDIED